MAEEKKRIERVKSIFDSDDSDEDTFSVRQDVADVIEDMGSSMDSNSVTAKECFLNKSSEGLFQTVSPEKSLQNRSPESCSESKSPEMTLLSKSTKEPSQANSPAHSFLASSAQESFQTKSPGEHSIPKSPEEHSIPKSPEEHSIPKSPEEHSIPKSPEEHLISKSPEEHLISKSPEEHLISKSPEEHLNSKSPEEHLIPKSPKEHSIPTSPEEHFIPQSSKEHSIPKSPEEHSIPKFPEENFIPQSPEEHSIPKSPEEHSIPKSPEEHSMPKSPEEHSIPKSPEEHSIPKSPNEHFMRESPEESLQAKSGVEPLRTKFSEESFLTKSPEKSLQSKSPKKFFLIKSSEKSFLTKSPEESFPSTSPEEYFQNKSHEDTFPGKLPEKSFKVKSPEDTFPVKSFEESITTDSHEEYLQRKSPSNLISSPIYISYDNVASSIKESPRTPSSDNGSPVESATMSGTEKPSTLESSVNLEFQDQCQLFSQSPSIESQHAMDVDSQSEDERYVKESSKTTFGDICKQSQEVSDDFSGFDRIESHHYQEELTDQSHDLIRRSSEILKDDLTLSSDESDTEKEMLDSSASKVSDEDLPKSNMTQRIPSWSKSNSDSSAEETYGKQSPVGHESTINLSSLTNLKNFESVDMLSASGDEESEETMETAPLHVVENVPEPIKYTVPEKSRVRVEDVFTDSEDEIEKYSPENTSQINFADLSKGPAKYGNENSIADLLEAFKRGWIRELVERRNKSAKIRYDVYYYTPCKRKLRSKNEIQAFLNRHGITDLTQKNFSFDKKPLGVDPKYEVIRDANSISYPDLASSIQEHPLKMVVSGRGSAKKVVKHTKKRKRDESVPCDRKVPSISIRKPKRSPVKPLEKIPLPQKEISPVMGRKFFSLPSMSQPRIIASRITEDVNRVYHCTSACPGVSESIPNLQCMKCLCLFHSQCVDMPEQCANLIQTRSNKFLCPNCYSKIRNSRPSFIAPDHYEPLASDPVDEDDDEDVYPFMHILRRVPDKLDHIDTQLSVDIPTELVAASKPVIPVNEVGEKVQLPAPRKNFLLDLGQNLKLLKLILSYLPASSLTTCAQTCTLFRDMALHPDLWKTVCLRNIRIKNLEQMAEFLCKIRTENLDLSSVILDDIVEMTPCSDEANESTGSQQAEKNDPSDDDVTLFKPVNDVTSAIFYEHAYSGVSTCTESQSSSDDEPMPRTSPPPLIFDEESMAEVVVEDEPIEIETPKPVKAPHCISPSRQGELTAWHDLFHCLSRVTSLKSVTLDTANPRCLEILLFHCHQLSSITNVNLEDSTEETCFDPSYLVNLTNLKSLELKAEKTFSWKTNFNFIKLPQLTRLILHGLKTPPQGWPYLGNNLITLSLSPVHTFNTSNWNNLSVMKNLKALELCGGMPHQDSDLCVTLSKINSLEKLSLVNWHIGPQLPTTLKKLTNIKIFSITFAKEGKGLEMVYEKRVATIKQNCKHYVKFQSSAHV